MNENGQIEARRQLDIIEACKQEIAEKAKEIGRPLTYHISTFGCQMNFKDSEKLAGILEQLGYVEAEDEKADFVLLNTCTVRENANLKVYGHLGILKSYKKKNPNMMIALCGCMMQEDVVLKKIQESYRFVDIIFGTHNIYKLAELIQTRMHSNRMVIDIWKDAKEIVEDLPSVRKYSFKAGVNIMFGCNNFCTYCIVPYVRGRERSREPEDIIAEIECMVRDGVVEVMLLGQNVNSYGKTLEQKITFAELLRRVEQIEGLKRIRFMTSHPKDLSDDLIAVMKDSEKICRHIHLPVQCGSSRLLEKMNRRYTKEQYLALVRKIREAMPDISLTTDIMVGFPGETEEDFQDTIDVVRQAEYDSCYTFIYSKRTGTPAAKEEQVPEEIVKERFQRLLDVVAEESAKRTGRLEGRTAEVLVEGVSEQDSSMVTGRLSNNLLVHFPGTEDMIGKLIMVRLDEAKGFYYIGSVVE